MSKRIPCVSDPVRLQVLREKLLKYREKWKVSERQIARFCGITHVTYRAFMAGDTDRYHDRVIRALELFMCDKCSGENE